MRTFDIPDPQLQDTDPSDPEDLAHKEILKRFRDEYYNPVRIR